MVQEKGLLSLFFDRQHTQNSLIYRIIINDDYLDNYLTFFKKEINYLKELSYNDKSDLDLNYLLNKVFLSHIKSFLLISKRINESNDLITLKRGINDLIKFYMLEISYINHAKSLLKEKVLFTQINLLNLDYMDIDVFIKDDLENNLGYFLEREVSFTFLKNIIPKFKNELNRLTNKFEKLFYKMQNENELLKTTDFLDEFLQLNIEKESLIINDILYYHFSSNYFLTLISQFKNAYKRINKNINLIFKQKNNFSNELEFYQVLDFFMNQPLLKTIKLKDKSLLDKYINYFLNNLMKEYVIEDSIKMPISIFQKSNLNYYRKILKSINTSEFKSNLSHINENYYHTISRDDYFTYVETILSPSQFLVFKEYFNTYMTQKNTIKYKEVFLNYNNINIIYYDYFFNLVLFNDSYEKNIA